MEIFRKINLNNICFISETKWNSVGGLILNPYFSYKHDVNKRYMINSFTALDFETANAKPWSVCQIGLVRVENGSFVNELEILIKPPNNFFSEKFSKVHGINPLKTLNSPSFDKVWPTIEPFIKNQIVVAHNGFNFDFTVLSETLQFYGIPVPNYSKYCTYKIFKADLEKLCRAFHIPLDPHHALSDARACARLFSINERQKLF